jgi:hypothetical protein
MLFWTSVGVVMYFTHFRPYWRTRLNHRIDRNRKKLQAIVAAYKLQRIP